MQKQLFILVITLSLFASFNSQAQKVRWSYAVNNSVKGYGVGTPWTYNGGFCKKCASIANEPYAGKEFGKNDIEPGAIHYEFMPFDSKQVIVIENYNAGGIARVEIGYGSKDPKKQKKKIVYQGETKIEDPKGYFVRNYTFDLIKGVTDVWVYLDYKKIPGLNQIAGVALADYKDPYKPGANLAASNPFVGELVNMNKNVRGAYNPKLLITSIDNKHIYSVVEDMSGRDKIYRSDIDSVTGLICKTTYSDYNYPDNISTASGLTAISQDNNTMYINEMNRDGLDISKVYGTKGKKGKTKWNYEKLKLKGFSSKGDYLNDLMSFDGKYIIVTMWKEKGFFEPFERDLYVAERIKGNTYSEFKRMGDDINTIGAEVPCFLAPDNKTLFFSSDGHIGYGEKDLFVTHRLDDTWTNWSQPINIGDRINSSETDNSFTIDTKGEYAYFVGEDSDIFRIELANPKKEEKIEHTIKPEPIIVLEGYVVDKKTNKPLQAKITYHNIDTRTIVGNALSNASTGKYSIALPKGFLYSYEAVAPNYISVSENFNTKDLIKTEIINKNLLLAPIEVGQVIRLNNIFFETAKADIKNESNMELEKLLGILTKNSSLKIEISGHTDNEGSDATNLSLSQKRAQAVVDWLIKKGIVTDRIVAKGYGENNPTASNETSEGRQLNRRVEFKIIQM